MSIKQYSPAFINSAVGALQGLALGDALGTTLEFKPRGSFTPIESIVGGGPFHLAPGQWTDDTSMALCLADSLLATGRLDLSDQLTRYVDWCDNGVNSVTGYCFDIGNTVSNALDNFKQSGNPVSGSDAPYSAGNGSLMRLAPAAIFFARQKGFSVEEALDNIGQSSVSTHAEPRCIAACQIMGWLLYQVFRGMNRNKASLLKSLDKYPLAVPDTLAHIINGEFVNKQYSEISGTGYVVDSLEAALWCFFHSENFAEGALLAANLGDDADTTAAIYGQLAGAFYGAKQLPQEWLDLLAWKDDIRTKALLLAMVPHIDKVQDFEVFVKNGISKRADLSNLTASVEHDYGYYCHVGLVLHLKSQRINAIVSTAPDVYFAKQSYLDCIQFISSILSIPSVHIYTVPKEMETSGMIRAWYGRLLTLMAQNKSN